MSDIAKSSKVPALLWLTALLQGAAVLVIEVLGARMLTPYFGTSHYVWTAQITVTLVALAAGYGLGARADQSADRPRVIRFGLLAAGVYTGLTPLVVEQLSYVSYHLPLAIGAMVTSVALFAVPLAALAAISPCLVGEAAAYVTSAGVAAGRMAAISTAGSVAGVLLVAYAFIPYFPSSATMYGLALSLIVSAVGLGVMGRSRHTVLVGLVSIAVVIGAAIREASAQAPIARHYREIDRAYSAYSKLQVWRALESPVLSLSTNFTFQNDYNPVTKEGADAFAYVLTELVNAYAPESKSALTIGLGVGIVPRHLIRQGVDCEVFELDPEVPRLAEKYFDADLSVMRLRIGDGRRLLHQTQRHFDLVILDAFHGDSTPSHLLSVEAFREIARIVGSRGLLVTNMWRDLEHEDRLLPAVVRTLQRVFKTVRVHDARLGNYYIVATNREELNRPSATESGSMVPQRLRSAVRESMTQYYDAEITEGLILRDDYNPADTIAAGYYESVRRAEAGLARPR